MKGLFLILFMILSSNVWGSDFFLSCQLNTKNKMIYVNGIPDIKNPMNEKEEIDLILNYKLNLKKNSFEYLTDKKPKLFEFKKKVTISDNNFQLVESYKYSSKTKMKYENVVKINRFSGKYWERKIILPNSDYKNYVVIIYGGKCIKTKKKF